MANPSPGKRSSSTSTVSGLPATLPDIQLHHGEAIWVLSQLGFQGGASKSTFYEYIKSLRKLGTPFERGSLGYIRRGLANYSFYHLMELALVLTLRVYYVVPDSLLVEITKHRRKLYQLYRRAFVERESGLGSPIVLQGSKNTEIRLQGAHLDLRIKFAGGKLEKFGPPKLISSIDALAVFAEAEAATRVFMPINLSRLSERVVETALRAPPLSRGSHWQRNKLGNRRSR
jgi:hypothetical protein